VFGEFLRSASTHITAATSFRSELPYASQLGVVRHLDRLVTVVCRYLTDLPPQPGRIYGPLRDGIQPAMAAVLALDRTAQSLRPAAAGAADTDTAAAHFAVAHLSAAADHLAAGRDLLHTHFITDPAGTTTACSYLAPLITSGPVTAALLASLADDLHTRAPWIATQARTRRANPGALTGAHLALRGALPWLEAAATAIQATQRAHYPLPAGRLLDAISVNAPPPRQPPSPGEPVRELCQRIPMTAERLRYAAFTFAPHARWSPAATSAAWRRDALASAITTHACELILSTLAERARQLGLEPAYRQQLQQAAAHMHQTWTSWRAVTGHWDILTTGHTRTPGTTPVAAEISDLVQQTGQLAYTKPHWTPACAHASQIRDPASLAPSPADVTAVLAAVNHAADAITRITAIDHQAIIDAATDHRLYIPTRLLSDKYDIPRPYTPAPAAHTEALLAAYNTALRSTTRSTTTLDNLASAVNAPSSVLAATRRAGATRPLPRGRRPGAEHYLHGPAPGRTEQALRKLRTRDPALLLRAAVIDQSARDLVAEATTKARSRASVTARRTPPAQLRQGAPPARIASQDMSTTRPGTGRPNPQEPLSIRSGPALQRASRDVQPPGRR
jgi:hypothetical protein